MSLKSVFSAATLKKAAIGAALAVGLSGCIAYEPGYYRPERPHFFHPHYWR